MQKRCAVFGGNGYIGKHLVYYLRTRGIEPFIYDITNGTGVNYKSIDITSSKSISSYVELDVDYIFMFSGLTGTYNGFDNYLKYNAVNELGLINLLDAIKKTSYRPRIIFPSTRLIYKGVDKPLKESDEKETKTIYAVNKLACEGILNAYNLNFDIPYSIFRICIPYGNLLSTDYSFGTIGFFIKQATMGKDITLYGGGHLKRTFTHMEDLCFQIIEGAFSPDSIGEIYNVGGETCSLREAAEIVAEKYCVKVVDVPWPDKDLRLESGHTYFDDSKIRTLLHINKYKKLKDFTNDL